jgi:threonine/homoserine/homoserine lactone efflux protein
VTTTGVLPFLGLACLVIAMPGQDTVLTIRNTLAGGRRAGLSTALSVCAGQSIWAASVSLGVGALIVASERAFVTLRVIASGFILFLGVGAGG